ncbi:putative L-lactate dehydrogenase [Azorhizobium caulinodans ORS 571]|uniref:Putative L-lactate dehydrogenase n=1 Tax=Azorhizobium caulinodans (strain ATCC 43989 / DSM 5975 / JCM 20966 / LMG 6465 / NBRC 14845 / NCIMB 13405 / ORS 571) TaxID=438753 RepID=A8I3U6_AZOC5|nr:alpha-hydroxy acid oxidase [Azorhizobium caulinodans]BAF87653.1 putative L-lactate dehydrogenase [Azorhizobium caulinodans ORS 571]
MVTLLNVEDARRLARRRLPRGLFEYLDRGTEDEVSIAGNRAGLDAIRLAPFALEDVSQRAQDTVLFGTPQPCPLVIAPTAVAGLMSYDGEVAMARAAKAHDIPFCVSTQSMTSIETIARDSGARLWFQLYVWKNRARTFALLDRAAGAGADTLVLTVDTAVSPKREYNQRNGFGIPLKPSVRAGIDVLCHPRWFADVFLRTLRTTGMPTYAHYPDEFRTALGRAVVGDEISLATDVSWKDVAALRAHWKGRLILKGILRASDATRAIAHGVDGIVVSNHGARNLDCAPHPAHVLPAIVAAAGGRLTVLADSGVRRGSDIAKYLALGADGVLVGRAPLYGLAAAGTPGASRVIELLRAELDTTMALLGVTRLDQLPRTLQMEA